MTVFNHAGRLPRDYKYLASRSRFNGAIIALIITNIILAIVAAIGIITSNFIG